MSGVGPLALTLVHANGTAVIEAEGEIDMATVPELREFLNSLVGHVVFDLAAVTFLDSTGIGVVVAARNRLIAAGGDLLLRSPRGIVRTALETVGMADWIETESQPT